MSRILIADDNPLSLRFFAEVLRLVADEVVTAVDGEDARARATESAFDLLIFDVEMPRCDGPEALRRVRADAAAASRATRALASTAADEANVHSGLIAAGFDGVVVKPIDADSLRKRVATYLPARAASAPTAAPLLDDARALEVAGGDIAIVTALRDLLRVELRELPTELAGFARTEDILALRARLHRLDASAGICGASALSEAIRDVRRAIADEPGWPDGAVLRLATTIDRLSERLQT